MKTKIIYEDKHILVVYKPAGIAVQAARSMEMDVVSELKNYLKSSYVGLVHRLDQPVEGILVFAKTSPAAAALSKQNAEGTMEKEYLAGVLAAGEIQTKATLTDYLLKDAKTNASKVVEASVKNAKKAVLSYEVQKMISLDTIKGGLQSSTETGILPKPKTDKIALLKIRLETGRHHQIRVQLANANLPLLGDLKYGTEQSGKLSSLLGIKMWRYVPADLALNIQKQEKSWNFAFLPKRKSCRI